MKFKVLKDFVSSIGNFFEGKHHDVELDDPTATMWTEHGLIEEVKEEPKSTVEDESQVIEPPQAPVNETPAPDVTPAAEAVTADETK